jgi:hypothetical protein
MVMRAGCQLQSTGWWIAFQGTERNNWFDRFTAPGFRHVTAFTALQDDQRFGEHVWLFVDPSVIGMRLEILTDAEMDAVLQIIAADAGRFLYLAQTPPPATSRFPRFGAYCVSEIERLLGLRARALRPIGLYRRLLDLGAQPAFEEITAHGRTDGRRRKPRAS